MDLPFYGNIAKFIFFYYDIFLLTITNKSGKIYLSKNGGQISTKAHSWFHIVTYFFWTYINLKAYEV